MFDEPEADKFARIARKLGVPPEAILIENKSSNTGENIRFSRNLLAERGMDPATFILVQKPYMERRACATFAKNWPGKDLIATSPQIPFEEYPNAEILLETVIHVMVGDLQRLRIYPEKGWQIPQEIPEDVWRAYERLVALGYDRHLAR